MSLDLLLRRALPLLVMSALAAACGGDDDEQDEPVEEPARLELRRLTPLGGSAWQPGDACLALGHDEAGQVAVEVAVIGGELRAPGACGGRTQCGHWELVVSATDFELTARSSGTSHTIALADAPTGGSVTFQVTLHGDTGEPLRAAGEPISDAATLRLEAPGGCPGD